MLKIRLARGGAKKRPYYYIVVADSHAPRDGKFIERVGSYNPMLPRDGEQKRVTLKADRIAEWLGKGAQPTDRVARFLSQDEALAGKVKWVQGNNPNKAQPGKKAQERAAAIPVIEKNGGRPGAEYDQHDHKNSQFVGGGHRPPVRLTVILHPRSFLLHASLPRDPFSRPSRPRFTPGESVSPSVATPAPDASYPRFAPGRSARR